MHTDVGGRGSITTHVMMGEAPRGDSRIDLLCQVLGRFAAQPDAPALLRLALGEEIDRTATHSLLASWRAGDFSDLPAIREVPAAVLRGAAGAYAAGPDLILLAAETPARDVLRVLLEEVGHALDARLNQVEAPGDEGAILAALILGEVPSPAALAAMRAEDDHGWVMLDGQMLQVEFSGTLSAADVGALKNGMVGTLGNVQSGMGAQGLGQDLPLLGQGLGAALAANNPAVAQLSTMQGAVLYALGSSGLIGPPDSNGRYTMQNVADAINQGMRAYGLVGATDTPATVTPDNEIAINTPLTPTAYTQTLEASQSLGLGGLLRAQSDGEVDLNITYALNLRMGIDSGVYVRTDLTTQELTAQLTVATGPDGAPNNPHVNVGGVVALGGAQLFTATVLPTTGIDASFSLDLQDASGKLYVSSLDSAFGNMKTTASGDLDFDLRLSTPDWLSGLLKVATDLSVDWSFTQDASGNFGSAPVVTFSNTKFDFLSFLTDTVLPFLDNLRTVMEPISGLMEVLTADIEALSGIEGARALLDVVDRDSGFGAGQDGEISLLDIAAFMHVPGIGALLSLASILDVVDHATQFLGGHFGDSGLFGVGDFAITNDIRDASFTLPNATGLVSGVGDVLGDYLDAKFDGASQATLDSILGAGANKLGTPILTDAQTSIGYLFGRKVDLLHFDLPKIAFTLGDRINADGSFSGGSLLDLVKIPIFLPGLTMELEGALRAYIDIDFGYDTTGLQHYMLSGTAGDPGNPFEADELLDGFYVTDWGADGLERPEAVLGLKFNLGAGLGIDKLLKFFVGGSIEGTINLDLIDGANGGAEDGRVYFDELAAQFSNPNGFYVGYGSIQAYLNAYVEMPFFTREWHSPSITLADFDFGDNRAAPFNPMLARIDDEGSLVLHSGGDAGRRETTDKMDGNEIFAISLSGGTKVKVTAFGYQQLFALDAITNVVGSGGNGNDMLSMQAGTVVGAELLLDGILFGNGGDDVLAGGAGNDLLSGDTGTDLLSGGAGSDTLIGGDDDDVLIGGAGEDFIHGGGGVNTVTYEASKASVRVVVNFGASSGGDAEGDIVRSVTRLIGADIDGAGDTLVGTFGGATGYFMSGLRGDDVLRGGVGADTLVGGLGNDLMDGSYDPDVMAGGLGDDGYVVDDVGDVVDEDAFGEGGGRDGILAFIDYSLLALTDIEDLRITGAARFGEGNALDNLIIGNGIVDVDLGDDFDDTLIGHGGADRILGRKGDDSLDGGDGADTLDGDSGADYLNAGDGADSLVGDAGADTLDGGTGADSLEGGEDADLLFGFEGNDLIAGGLGADTLNGEAGADTLDGGGDGDLILVDDANDLVLELADGGADTVQASVAYVLADAAMVELLLTGNAAATTPLSLRGNVLAQRLVGNAGDNVLEGMGGADTLDGAGGFDTAYYEHASAAVRVDIFAGIRTGDAAGDSYIGIAAFRGSDGFADTLAGNGLADRFEGLGGDDLLSGSGGTDLLFGGLGADTLDGGGAADTLAGGAGNDVYLVDLLADVVEDSRAGYLTGGGGGTDRIIASLDYTLGDPARSDIEELQLRGAALRGTGNSLANLLIGTTGANTLDGAMGADTLVGGLGNDLLLFDVVGDRVVEDAAGGIDEIRITTAVFFDTPELIATFDMSAAWLLGTEHVRLMDNVRAVHLFGNALDNRLVANNGANTLSGGDGADTLAPGLGNDTVLGGAGNDLLLADFTAYGGEGGQVIQDATSILFFNRFSGRPGATLLYSGIEIFDLTGTSGHDVLNGGALADRLIGADGDDQLDSRIGGAETIDGGGGTDRWIVDLSAIGSPILLSLAQSQLGPVLLSEGSRISGIEALTMALGGGADSISAVGFRQADTISGGAGNDTLNPGLGNDVLDAGEGTDLLQADFTAYSGEGGQVIQDATTILFFNRFSGRPGATLSYSGIEIFDLTGTSGHDVLHGGALADRLVGADGDDDLDSRIGGAETIDGGLGSDRWTVDLGAVATPILLSLAASQVAPVLLSNGTRVAGIEALAVTLGGGADSVSSAGFSRNDSILGGAGNDSINPGLGNDTVVGGLGIDLLQANFTDYSGEGGVVVQNATSILFYNRFSGSPRQTLAYAEFERFDLTGTSGGDTLNGGTLTDRLIGAGGDDMLDSRTGLAETIDGGAGTDRWIADLATVGTAVHLNLLTSLDSFATLSNGTKVAGIEALTLTLGGGADSISAASFVQNDRIIGGAGNDSIDPGLGNDVISGDAGVDLLRADFTNYSGESGRVIQDATGIYFYNRFSGSAQRTLTYDGFERFDLTGTTGDDVLNGGALTDRLIGGAGSDLLDSRTGLAETIDGGAGTDRWLADLSTVGLPLRLSLMGSQATPTLLSNGTSVGGIEALTITLGRGADSISAAGFSQADTIISGAGDDSIDPGLGNDVVSGGTGTDMLVADFTAYSGEGGVVLHTGVGIFFYNRFSGSPQRTLTYDGFERFDLTGTTGGDTLHGGALTDRLIGGDGDDRLDSGTGLAETIDGGAGTDRWLADLATVGPPIRLNLLTSQTSFATLPNRTKVAGIEALTLTLGRGADSITAAGFTQNDSILGGAGNDSIDPGLGNDTVSGGAGVDLLRADFTNYSGESGRVFQDATGIYFYNRFSGSPQRTLTYDGFERFDLTGTTGTDVLNGGALTDRLIGGAGDDRLDSRTGLAETIHGGEGTDHWLADLGTVRTDIRLNLVTSQVNFTTLSNGTKVAGIEALTLTLGSGADSISAAGLSQNDTILGGPGADTINPGLGNDLVNGGTSRDLLVVDFTAYSGEGGRVIQDPSALYFYNRFSGSPVRTLTYSEFERFDLTGTTGNDLFFGAGEADRLIGGDGADDLSGLGGDDTIDGGLGADTMRGGEQADLFTVDNINDVIVGALGDGIDTVRSWINYTLTATVENLILLNTLGGVGVGNTGSNVLTGTRAADTLDGQARADTLDGDAGRDSLIGGLGDDLLIGNFGGDTLSGGQGIDAFRYLSSAESRDTILDFTQGEDRLEILAAGFGGGLVAGGTLTAAFFASNATGVATAGTAQFTYATSTGNLRWDADGTGPGDSELIARLASLPALAASDILLI